MGRTSGARRKNTRDSTERKLIMKPSKTTVGNTSVEFLGHIVSGGEIKPDNAKTQKILDIRTLTTKKEVRNILRLLNYYRRFVPNFSGIAHPLTSLTKKNGRKKIMWSEDCGKSSLSQMQLMYLSY
ncbi:retrovirus-related pol polyprotein from transposon 17.6 [Plakobranchus ocellatus]|uniref:Retrovirus-related pol polyprotein from transposon 17.6 n=1 Tax=Plakobranchus ocellatus TaxID=259542 RepID=A0AAV3WXX8_9GAST|nr:retrovirus-related pol polyprotein from transposon 17.6 [Plakobranchus ocellatus]